MKLVLATSNKGKLAEIAPILQAFGFDALPQNQFGFMDAEETGLTFVENALIKARHACRQTGLPALAEMAALTEPVRTARFYCCMVLLKHADDPQPIIAEGIWHGEILKAPSGTEGFGYDPIFWVPALQMSAAQMPAELKNSISHRGQALQQLKQKLQAHA